MNTETTSFAGGCQCGAVRYTLTVPKIIAYACHCLECQKQSASAFALSVPVTETMFDIDGPVQIYKRDTDSGTSTHCHYCATCGTRLYHRSGHSTGTITLKGGTLDSACDLVPLAHLWTLRKHRWLELPRDAVCFDTQPEDLKAWRDGLLAALG